MEIGKFWPLISLASNVSPELPTKAYLIKISNRFSGVQTRRKTKFKIYLTDIAVRNMLQGMMNELLTKGIGHTEFKDSAVGRIPVEWEITTLKKGVN